jgi:L-threonylcarbamoyladenylate synthase
MKTLIKNKNDLSSIEQTADILKQGGIVIIPTDTVYGFSGIVDLKGAATHFETDSKIRAIKGRAETKPLIQLIAKPEDIRLYTNDDIPSSLLAKWPGALTIIVHIKDDAPLAPTAIPESRTVAFRCPGDEWLRKIIELCEAPIFSTSVNRSGQPVLDTTNSITTEFENEVDLIIDDGNKKGALPSTLVTIENGEVKVLRQGSVQI